MYFITSVSNLILLICVACPLLSYTSFFLWGEKKYKCSSLRTFYIIFIFVLVSHSIYGISTRFSKYGNELYFGEYCIYALVLTMVYPMIVIHTIRLKLDPEQPLSLLEEHQLCMLLWMTFLSLITSSLELFHLYLY